MAYSLAKLVTLFVRFIQYLSRLESPKNPKSWKLGMGQLLGAVLVGSAIGYAIVKHVFLARQDWP